MKKKERLFIILPTEPLGPREDENSPKGPIWEIIETKVKDDEELHFPLYKGKMWKIVKLHEVTNNIGKIKE